MERKKREERSGERERDEESMRGREIVDEWVREGGRLLKREREREIRGEYEIREGKERKSP